jgi:putative aldouronate transport system substrate-binding protein
MFAGCGSSASESTPTSTPESSAASAAALESDASEATEVAAPETVSVEEPAEADADADADADATAYPFPLDETVTFTYMNTFNPSLAGILDGWNAVATVQEYEKMTNVHIEYLDISPDVFSEQFNLRLTSGDLPDFIENAAATYTGGAAGGIEDEYYVNLLDYAAYMPTYMEKLAESETLSKAAYIDENTIGCFYELQDATNVNGCIIRNDWLDALGMSAPVTYDDTHDVLLAMQSELGIAHPLELPSFLDYQWNCFAGNFGTVGSFDIIGMSQQLFVVDGEVRYAMYTDEYEDYVTMLANWYAEGLIDPDFINYEMVRDYQDKINSGEVGYYLNDASNLQSTQEATEADGADWIGIRLPVQEEGQINHLTNYYEAVSTLGAVAISTNCADIETAVAWMDYRMTDEISFLFDFGIEGQSYTYGSNHEIQWTDLILNNESLTQQQALTIYTGNEGGSAERNMSLYSERQKSAVENWQTDVDGDYIYPTSITLDGDVSTEASGLLGDIRTYISETVLRFVTGEKDLSEFGEFRSNLKDMGIERVIEIYQDAYDAYMA